PRLAGARRVRIDLLRPDHGAERERDEYERQPAEGGGLPVRGAPAAHARGQVARLAVMGGAGGHGGSPLSAPRSRGVGEGGVEGGECAPGRNGEVGAVAVPDVVDLDGECVLAPVPEQEDVDSVALPGCEFAGVVGGAGHLVFLLLSMTSPTLRAPRPPV